MRRAAALLEQPLFAAASHGGRPQKRPPAWRNHMVCFANMAVRKGIRLMTSLLPLRTLRAPAVAACYSGGAPGPLTSHARPAMAMNRPARGPEGQQASGSGG